MITQFRRVVLERTARPEYVENSRRYLELFEKEIGPVRLRDLSRAVLNDARERILKQINCKPGTNELGRNATCNRYFNTFFRMCSLAETTWGWEEAERIPRLPRLKENKPRTLVLNEEQRKRLLAACKGSANKQLYLLVVLGIATGCRRGELLQLRWSSIDLSTGTAVVTETKTDEPKRIKFTDIPLKLLIEYKNQTGGHPDLLFPSKADPNKPFDFKKSWDTARKRAKLPPGFVFHSLRHSFASDLAAIGVTIQDIAELMGHKSIQTTQRYAHLTKQRLDDLVSKVNKVQFNS